MTRIAAICLIAIGMAVSFASCSDREERYTLTLDRLHLHANDRILFFRIDVSDGQITSVRRMPPAWSVTIVNEGNGMAHIEGQAEVGAAALRPEDFRRFLVLMKSVVPARPFQVSGELEVQWFGMPERASRTITLAPDQIQLHKGP